MNCASDNTDSRVLILELGGIGDVILSIPAVLAFCNTFQRSEITILTVPRSRTVLERLIGTEWETGVAVCSEFEVMPFPLQNGLPASKEALLRLLSLRRRNYDLLVDLSAIESRLAGIRRRMLVGSIGAEKKVGRGTDERGGFFDMKTPEQLSSSVHEMNRKLDVAALLHAISPVQAPIFPILGIEREEAAAFCRKQSIDESGVIALMNPCGIGSGKRWPANRFAAVGQWLTDNLGAWVVVVGGPDDEMCVQEVCQNAGDGKLIPSTALSVGALAALMERSSLFVTNDSGPMHMAAALGVPTVAIFGQTNHARYLPLLPVSRRELAFADPALCRHGWKGGEHDECRRKECDRPECIEAVSVDAVISKLETLCSRIGFLYSTRCPRSSQEDEKRGDPEPVKEYAREDAGYITQQARKLSLDLVRTADGPILDVACGKGYLLDDLLEDSPGNRDLWGLDISISQLKSASTLLRRQESCGGNGKPNLVLGDLACLPFRSGVFPVSLCINTFLNLNGNGGLTKYLAEISRVTRSGGSVFVEVRNPMNPLVLFRFLFGRLLHGIPLRVHRLGDVIEAGGHAGLSLSSRESVGPIGGVLAYSYILVFTKGSKVAHKNTVNRDPD